MGLAWCLIAVHAFCINDCLPPTYFEYAGSIDYVQRRIHILTLNEVLVLARAGQKFILGSLTFFGILSNRAYLVCCIAKSIHIKGFYRHFCRASLAQRFCSRLASSDPAGSNLACCFFVILFVFFQAFFLNILLLGSELVFGAWFRKSKKKKKRQYLLFTVRIAI